MRKIFGKLSFTKKSGRDHKLSEELDSNLKESSLTEEKKKERWKKKPKQESFRKVE